MKTLIVSLILCLFPHGLCARQTPVPGCVCQRRLQIELSLQKLVYSFSETSFAIIAK